jgi:hypothetical protein
MDAGMAAKTEMNSVVVMVAMKAGMLVGGMAAWSAEMLASSFNKTPNQQLEREQTINSGKPTMQMTQRTYSGCLVGCMEGCRVGCDVGCFVGWVLGWDEGCLDGNAVGCRVGCLEG